MVVESSALHYYCVLYASQLGQIRYNNEMIFELVLCDSMVTN